MFRSVVASWIVLAAAGLAPAAAGADRMFDELNWDFGSVPRGPTIAHPFHLTNKSHQPLHIAGARVSCGCTTAQALQADLLPGQSTAIIVQMDTRRFTGAKAVTIYVTFDQPQWEEVRLGVQANARDDVTLTPESLAFGQVKRGTSPMSTIQVQLLGGNDWQVTGARCDSNYVQTQVVELRRDPSLVNYEIRARIRGDAPVGKWYTDVWLTTNHPISQRLRIPLTVEIESALSVSPAVAVLGQVKVGQPTERRVIGRGVKPFHITSISGTDQWLSVEDVAKTSKPVHVLTVRLKADQPGEFSRNLRILTDLADDNEIAFEATALVIR